MRRKIIQLFFIFVLSIGFLSMNQSSVSAAQDDITGIALEKEMRDLIQRGIMEGYGEGEYRPDEEVTRGQFAALMARALKLPEPAEGKAIIFPDVPKSSKLANDIHKASEAKIINGHRNGYFGMDDNMTREQAAQIIDNALEDYKKIARNEAPLSFEDADQISDTHILAVARNVHDKIIAGVPLPNGKVEFQPKNTATRAQAAAFISRMLTVIEQAPAEEEPPTGEEPPVQGEKDTYRVATIDGNKNLVPGSQTYKAFADAKKAATKSNQVVTFNDKIISMPSGLVISTPSASTTSIYDGTDFKNSIAYVNSAAEMEYIESTDKYVKVNLAGRTGYVQHKDVTLLPYQQVEKRNSYSVNGVGELVFHIYNQLTEGSFSYEVGKAPSFLKQGEQYYSWDGATFFNKAGQKVGTAYQYFNYLPARTVTSYSAAELDAYINHALAQREELYKNNPTRHARYKDATTTSKLLGLGTALKDAEKNYRINALMMLSIAINESDFGMSTKALTKNNLFGINAVDSNPDQADSFKTPADSIKALAVQYFNEKYLNYERPFYSNGAILGNKAVGVNVRYASDPYWGQKNASYMYQADKYLGGKDSGKYEIGVTNTLDLNARKGPATAHEILFTYPKAGMPVAILESTKQRDGSTWHKVVSERLDIQEAYIHGAYVTPVPVVK